MKILILNGSPRPQGNTAKMAAAFRETAVSAGHEVVSFDVCRMNIKGCLACEYCHGKGGGKCIQKDDMHEIYAEQVGSIGETLPSNDTNIKTKSGDIMLYSSDQMVIFYGSNSWAYTRLGKITNKSAGELKELLGGDGVTVTVIAE